MRSSRLPVSTVLDGDARRLQDPFAARRDPVALGPRPL